MRLANQSHLGLNAYVFTKNAEHGRRIAERVEAGSVLVNDVHLELRVRRGAVRRHQGVAASAACTGDDALREMAERRGT